MNSSPNKNGNTNRIGKKLLENIDYEVYKCQTIKYRNMVMFRTMTK